MYRSPGYILTVSWTKCFSVRPIYGQFGPIQSAGKAPSLHRQTDGTLKHVNVWVHSNTFLPVFNIYSTKSKSKTIRDPKLSCFPLFLSSYCPELKKKRRKLKGEIFFFLEWIMSAIRKVQIFCRLPNPSQSSYIMKSEYLKLCQFCQKVQIQKV